MVAHQSYCDVHVYYLLVWNRLQPLMWTCLGMLLSIIHVTVDTLLLRYVDYALN